MRTVPRFGGLLAVCLAFAGCASRTDVSLTGNAPAQYTHVFVTAQAIWFNTSATAAPGDTGWTKLTLNDPVTVDLLNSLDGTLTDLLTNAQVPTGTYSQVRLIPVDASAALVSSASAAGAIYNSEVDYQDSTGSYQAPLELVNPDVGIGISTSLKITGSTSTVFSGATSSTGTSSDTTSSTTTDTTSSTSSTTPQKFAFALNLDGARDLVQFAYAATTAPTGPTLPGVLLNPHMTAYDTSQSGGIQGALTLTDLANITSEDGRVDIQVTAETVSADGTRHTAVNSASVRSDGTFLVYPLATSTDTPTSYDLVIHGPHTATIVVKSIPVAAGDPSTTAPVSVGTLVPRAATPYTVNLSTTNPLPAGALVGFYQTLPDTGEVPYLIEEQPIDPFSRKFAVDPSISGATLDYGTYSSGAAPALTAATPTEGNAAYRVSATAPLFTDGVLTTTVSSSSTITIPTLSVASGATPATLSALVSVSVPGEFDHAELLLSHDGAIIATAPVNTATLGSGGTSTVTFSGLPAGTTSSTFDQGLYYLAVRAWNTSQNTTQSEVSGSVVWESFPVPVDLRSGSTSNVSLIID